MNIKKILKEINDKIAGKTISLDIDKLAERISASLENHIKIVGAKVKAEENKIKIEEPEYIPEKKKFKKSHIRVDEEKL